MDLTSYGQSFGLGIECGPWINCLMHAYWHNTFQIRGCRQRSKLSKNVAGSEWQLALFKKKA